MILAFGCSLFVCVFVVALGLPANCWRCVWMNCHRLDGSVSRNRIRRESSAFRDYLLTISVPALLTFCVFSVLASAFFTSVIPLELMARGIAGFDLDPVVWRENVESVRTDHTQFLIQRGAEEDQIQATQRLLWYGSPDVAIGLVFAFLGTSLFFNQVFRGGITSLVTGIRKRRKNYARCDVSRMRRGQQVAVQQSSAN